MSKNAVVEVEKTEKVNGNGHLFRPGRGRSRTVVVDAKDLARAVEHERNVQWKGVVRHEWMNWDWAWNGLNAWHIGMSMKTLGIIKAHFADSMRLYAASSSSLKSKE